MSTILLIAVILLIIFGPTLFASLLEKRMVWPYGPVRKKEIDASNMGSGDNEKINNYLIRYINDAMGKGFEYLGCFNDAKGSRYKIVYHALVSPDKYTLAIIGGGEILWMQVWGTRLFSKSDNENCYYTVDNQSSIDKDLSKLWHDHLVFADDFAALYEKHQKWIQVNVVSLKIYPSGGELEEYRRARRYRFDYMEKLGYIRYLDNDKEYWKYKLLGAIKFSFLGIVIGIFRHVKALKPAR